MYKRQLYAPTVSRFLDGIPSTAIRPLISRNSSVERLEFSGDQSRGTCRNHVDSASLRCRSKPGVAADVEDADVLS